MNQFDMNQLMNLLSKMDKKDLEKGLEQASKILKTSDKEEILKKLKPEGK